MNPEDVPATDLPPAPAPPPEFDLGVLFVHGIGQQPRGQTLVACGEPLHAFLQRRFAGHMRAWHGAGLRRETVTEWFEGISRKWDLEGDAAESARRFDILRPLFLLLRKTGAKEKGMARSVQQLAQERNEKVLAARATFRGATLRDPATASPSHAPMELTIVDVAGEPTTSRWLLAESWWAQSFEEPTFRALGAWLLKTMPTTICSHFGIRARRSWTRVKERKDLPGRVGRLLSFARLLALLLLSVPIAIVAEVAVLVVVLLALLPIPSLRAALQGVERTLASTLGDSLTLTGSPLQRAAIVGQVLGDATWLSQRCRQVAVVAHSQGAAVAHLMLRVGVPQNVRLLITYGSGLRKLEEITQSRRGARELSPAVDESLRNAVVVSLGALAVLTWQAIAAFTGDSAHWTIVATGLLFLAAGLMAFTSGIGLRDLSYFSLLFEEQGKRWIDYVASADPVPNGTLQDYDADLKLPESHEIRNESSFLRDHVSYWGNEEQFVSRVAVHLAALVDGPIARLITPESDTWRRAVALAGWRVNALVAARWAGIMSVAWAVVSYRAEWVETLRWIGSSIASVAGKALPWDNVAASPPPGPRSLALGVGLATAMYAVSRVGRLLWDMWAAREQPRWLNADLDEPKARPPSFWARLVVEVDNAVEWPVTAFFFCASLSPLMMIALRTGAVDGWRDVYSVFTTSFLVALVARWGFLWSRRRIVRHDNDVRATRS